MPESVFPLRLRATGFGAGPTINPQYKMPFSFGFSSHVDERPGNASNRRVNKDNRPWGLVVSTRGRVILAYEQDVVRLSPDGHFETVNPREHFDRGQQIGFEFGDAGVFLFCAFQSFERLTTLWLDCSFGSTMFIQVPPGLFDEKPNKLDFERSDRGGRARGLLFRYFLAQVCASARIPSHPFLRVWVSITGLLTE